MNTLLFLLLFGFTIVGILFLRGTQRRPFAVLRDSARLLVSAVGLTYLVLVSLVGGGSTASSRLN